MYEFETIFVHIFPQKIRECWGKQGIPILEQFATGILQNTCLQQGILTILFNSQEFGHASCNN